MAICPTAIALKTRAGTDFCKNQFATGRAKVDFAGEGFGPFNSNRESIFGHLKSVT
jgi:hypothetical protein